MVSETYEDSSMMTVIVFKTAAGKVFPKNLRGQHAWWVAQGKDWDELRDVAAKAGVKDAEYLERRFALDIGITESTIPGCCEVGPDAAWEIMKPLRNGVVELKLDGRNTRMVTFTNFIVYSDPLAVFLSESSRTEVAKHLAYMGR